MTNAEAIEYLEWIRPIKPYSLDRIKVQQSIDLAIKALENERPQGECIEVEPTKEDIEYGFDIRIVCSRCYKPDSHYSYDEYYKPNGVWYFRPDFCPHCGADMRGGR